MIDDDELAVAQRLSDAIGIALSEQAAAIGAVSIEAALGALVACIGKTVAGVPDRGARRRYLAEVVKALPKATEHARERHVRAGLPDTTVRRTH